MINPTIYMSRTTIRLNPSLLLLLILPMSVLAQDVIAPPTIGQETQGEPAVTVTEDISESPDPATPEGNTEQKEPAGLLGTTHISELRRENGRVYRVELEHSSGSKQTIEELGASGSIESSNTDIDNTPNLAKWRLGSW